MGKFLSRELTIGQCDPAGDAFFSRNKDRSVYINKWYSDTDQSDARSRKIYSLSGNLSCLFFCNLLWEMTSSNEE